MKRNCRLLAAHEFYVKYLHQISLKPPSIHVHTYLGSSTTPLSCPSPSPCFPDTLQLCIQTVGGEYCAGLEVHSFELFYHHFILGEVVITLSLPVVTPFCLHFQIFELIYQISDMIYKLHYPQNSSFVFSISN